MLPPWLFTKFKSTSLIAYDDAQEICYIQIDDTVYELDYRFLENSVADEERLKRLLSLVGKKVWSNENSKTAS